MKNNGSRWWHNPAYRGIGVLVLVGLVLSILALSNVVSRRLKGEREGVGKIITVSEHQLVVENRKQVSSQVLYGPNTTIDLGQQTKLEPGQMVYVIGDRKESNRIEARYIKVLEENR